MADLDNENLAGGGGGGRNAAKPEDDVVMDQILSRRVTPVPFWKLFFTQTDWTAANYREAWYGHHWPASRTLLFSIMFSSLVSLVVSTIIAPAFWRLHQEHHLDNLGVLHRQCASSLCGNLPSLTCVVDDHKKVHLEHFEDRYRGQNVPLTPACTKALDATKDVFRTLAKADSLPLDYVLSGAKMSDVDLDETEDSLELDKLFDYDVIRFASSSHASLQSSAETTKTTTASTDPDYSLSRFFLSEIQANCSVSLFFDGIGDPLNFPFLSTEDLVAGNRVEGALDRFVCPMAMPENLLQFWSGIALVHEAILGPLMPVFVFFLVFACVYVFTVAQLLSDVFNLLLTTLVLRWVLPWPKDFVGQSKITYWSTFQVLLLLCTLTPHLWGFEWLGLIVGGLFAAISYKVYQNKEAAMEWCFLGALLYGYNSLVPLLDDLAGHLRAMDGLGLFQLAWYWVVGPLIPGQGWWKLVRVYVFWRTFPRRKDNSSHSVKNE